MAWIFIRAQIVVAVGLEQETLLGQSWGRSAFEAGLTSSGPVDQEGNVSVLL